MRTTRTTGDRYKVIRFNAPAAITKMAPQNIAKPNTKGFESCPAGIARVRVRGLAASNSASAQRLNAMAQERAAIIATRIHAMVRRAGRPPAARIVAVSAKGSAKMECSHLIISSVVRVLPQSPGMVEPMSRVYRGGMSLSQPSVSSTAAPLVPNLGTDYTRSRAHHRAQHVDAICRGHIEKPGPTSGEGITGRLVSRGSKSRVGELSRCQEKLLKRQHRVIGSRGVQHQGQRLSSDFSGRLQAENCIRQMGRHACSLRQDRRKDGSVWKSSRFEMKKS